MCRPAVQLATIETLEETVCLRLKLTLVDQCGQRREVLEEAGLEFLTGMRTFAYDGTDLGRSASVEQGVDEGLCLVTRRQARRILVLRVDVAVDNFFRIAWVSHHA